MMNNPQLLDENIHIVKNFDCGHEALNVFIQRYAAKQQKKCVGRTFVIVNSIQEIIGFYTLSTGSVGHHEAPEILTAGLPKYPIPTVTLGRLAVHKLQQGFGLGGRLLKDALSRVLSAAENLGIVAIIVHAKDENAINFYKKYGFISFDKEPQTLFLQIKTIIKAKASSLENYVVVI